MIQDFLLHYNIRSELEKYHDTIQKQLIDQSYNLYSYRNVNEVKVMELAFL